MPHGWLWTLWCRQKLRQRNSSRMTRPVISPPLCLVLLALLGFIGCEEGHNQSSSVQRHDTRPEGSGGKVIPSPKEESGRPQSAKVELTQDEPPTLRGMSAGLEVLLSYGTSADAVCKRTDRAGLSVVDREKGFSLTVSCVPKQGEICIEDLDVGKKVCSENVRPSSTPRTQAPHVDTHEMQNPADPMRPSL